MDAWWDTPRSAATELSSRQHLLSAKRAGYRAKTLHSIEYCSRTGKRYNLAHTDASLQAPRQIVWNVRECTQVLHKAYA